MRRDRHKPSPGRLKLWLLTLGFILSPMAGAASHASAQPNPGIDPCTRALARMATPTVPGTPDSEANRLAVSQSVMNFASCFNRQNWNGIIDMTTPGFLSSFLGVTEDQILPARLHLLATRGLLPQLRIQSIEEHGTIGTALATLAVTWQAWNGVHQEDWRLQAVNGIWLLAGRTIERPQISGVSVGMQLIVSSKGLSTPTHELVDPGTVIFAFENRTDLDITALILSVPRDSTISAVMTICNESRDLALSPAGMVQIAAGETAFLPLMKLDPGRYALLTDLDPCSGSTSIDPAFLVLIDISA